MQPKAPRNMQVTPDTLEHREPGAAAEPTALEAVRAELAALKARIEAAKQLQPQPHERHCLDCFQKGRNAAIRAITGHA